MPDFARRFARFSPALPAPDPFEGLLDPAPIRRCWQEHLSGRRDAHIELWDVLMLQAWLRERTSVREEVAQGDSRDLPDSVGWR